jgi:hypothetical protein
VTIYWGGADVRLQTLTAGLYRFQVQFRQVNHPWQRLDDDDGSQEVDHAGPRRTLRVPHPRCRRSRQLEPVADDRRHRLIT